MNVLTGYTKGTLSDNYLLSAAGGHIPLDNSSGSVPLSNNTLNKDLFADKARTLPYFTIPSSGELSKDTNDATKLIPKYIKIGTINIPLTSWYRGSIMLIFHDYEIYKLNGDILMIQCITGGNKVGALPAIRWKTKHDKSTEDSIIISKVDDNTYDLYFEAKFSWMTFCVYYLTKEESVFNFNIGSWSLVKPNPITTRSTLLNVSSAALTLSPEYVANLNDVARDTFIDGRFLATNTPYSNYFTGISLSNSELKYKYQFGFSSTGIPFVRYNNNSTWLPWKLLAFTSDISSLYVTLTTDLTITGLKTFESNSSTTGVSLILKNKGWAGSMQTAMDFYNGSNYKVPNARISTLMNGSGSAGGTLIFYTQTKASANPNPNGLVERFRIGDDNTSKLTGDLTVDGKVNDVTIKKLFVSDAGETQTTVYNTLNVGTDYVLASIRYASGKQSVKDPWLANNYSAGIGFGGMDTKGALSLGMYAPNIKFAAADSNSGWWLLLTGTSSTSYNLDLFTTLTKTNELLGDYLPRQRMKNPAHTTSEIGGIPFNVLALKAAGTPLYDDPEFFNGLNSVKIYNNKTNTNVSITHIEDNLNSANSSGKIVQISSTNGETAPGRGGFYQVIQSRKNAIFVQIFRAKIPVGYKVVNAENSMGAGYNTYWLTDLAGTGKWEWYCRVTLCGTDGFSTGGHVFLEKTDTNALDAVTWYLSYCNAFDLSKGNYDGLRTKLADSVAWSGITNKPTSFAPSDHASSLVTSLSGYSKATSASDLATTDTLNAALGKLEYKSDYAYDWITNVTATDTDEYINKWGEIVDFLDSVKEGTDILDEFVTRKTTQTITGAKTFSGGVTLNCGLNINSTNPITWHEGTHRQRIQTTDDAVTNTAVFTFQQSTDTGSSWNDLFTIKDNGHVVATKFVGEELSVTGNISTTNGYLISTHSDKTISIGSDNSSFCHYITTADNHYFNKTLHVNGSVMPYDTTKNLGSLSARWANLYSKGVNTTSLIVEGNLILKRNPSVITYCKADGTVLGYLGYNEANVPIMYKADGSTNYPLVYSLKYTDSTYTKTPYDLLLENYDSMPTNVVTPIYLSHGSASMAIGYRINNTYKYGGWFGATYNEPWFISVYGDTWLKSTLIHSNNYLNYLGYVGTTAVQKTSAILTLTGISGITFSGGNEYFDQYGNFHFGTTGTTWGVYHNDSSVLLKLTKSTGLVEAKSFKVTGGISSQFLKADGSVDNNTYLTSSSLIPDTSVTWSSTGLSGYTGPVSTALCGPLKGNRFAGIKAEAVSIEYSRDAGATWYDYEAAGDYFNSLKRYFFNLFSASFILGKNSDNTTSNDNYRLRVTVDCNIGQVYSALQKAILYVTTNNSNNCTVTVLTSNNNTTYTDRGTYYLSGWSGYNEIPLVGITADPSARGGSYSRYIRFLFSAKYVASSEAYAKGLTIMGIEVFGGVGWTTPNNHIAKYGRPYTFDYLGLTLFYNTVYPAANDSYNLGSPERKWYAIYASRFMGNVSGSATSVIDFGNGTSAIKIGYAGAALTTTEHFAAYSTTSDGTRCIKDISVASVKTVLDVPDNTTAHISAKAFGSDLRYIDKTTDLDTLSYGMYASYDNYDYTNGPKLNFGLMVMRINSGYTGLLAFGYGSSNLMYRSKSWNTDGDSTWKEWLTIAYMTDIPTKVSLLENDSNYVTGGPYLPTAGGTMTGNITVCTGADGRGLVFGTSKLNSLSNQLIWQSSEAIRFGSSSWDWNSWAGLKYDSTNKIIYLGIPDNVIFNANSAQSGGQIKCPGVASLYMGSTNLTESTLNIVNTAGGKDLGLTIQGTLKKIGFMIGSGNSNNGWYDFTSGVDKWIMYRSSNAGNVIFNYPVLSSKFVGDVTGNATSATKATQDGDGNTISSTYFKKLSRPDTGFNIDEIELFGMRDILPSSEITRAGTFPFDLWGSLMSFNGQNYFVQLATQGTSSGMYFRSAYGGGIKLTDKPWVKFLDSSNYTNYTVNKDGTGASGTWGINITGSSNSASYANRLTEYHNLDRQHDLDVIEPWNMPIGIMIRFKNPTGANTRAIGSQWNTIVSMNGYVGSSTSGAGYRHEFLFSDSLNHNDGTFWVRNGVDDLWNDWVKVVTAKNYKDAIPTATTSAAGLMSTSDKTKLDAVDSTYLKLTGGQISSSATTPLSINSTSGTESGLRFDVNKVSSGWVGYDTTNGVQLFSYKGGSKILGIKDDGTPHFSGNTLLHGANYTNYTVKKDGTGAAGTWNISITGSSGSCTGNAATATCIQRPSANTTELPTGTTVCSDGMKFVRSVYNTVNRPATYGNVIQIGGSGHSQLFLEWSGSSATTGKVYYKSKRDVSTTEWGDWVQLIDERDVVTTSKAGLMSAADKTKLDGITGSVTNNLVIKLNNGTAEGTNLFTFNGSEAKTINITPASINALASNGTASAAIRLSSKGDNTNANTLCFYSASISSTTLSAMNSWTRPTDGSNNAMVLRMYKTANTGHDIYAASDKDSLWHRNSSNATSKWAKILDSLNCYGIYNITINSNNISIEHISGKQLIPNINEIPIQGANRAYYAWTADETPDSYDELVFLILPKATVLSGGGFYYYNLTAVVNQYGIYIICDSNDPSGLRGYASDNVPCRTIIFHL